MNRRALIVGIVVGLLMLAGCDTLALEKSISMETVYRGPQQTDVTIHYTVPLPPPGKIYVLWILNPAEHDIVNAGQVPGGRNLTARATVPFEATGVVVSIEDQPNPPRMSNTWALKVGSVTPETPTPRAAPSTNDGTPAANSTPARPDTPTTPTIAVGP